MPYLSIFRVGPPNIYKYILAFPQDSAVWFGLDPDAQYAPFPFFITACSAPFGIPVTLAISFNVLAFGYNL